MHIYPTPILSRTTLNDYTSWYRTENGYRAIVTSDGVSLHLGSISHVCDNILETWDLRWSNIPTFRIGGDSAEERALNAEFQASKPCVINTSEVSRIRDRQHGLDPIQICMRIVTPNR